MRKITLFWLILAFAAGWALFHTSQKVQDSRHQLARLESSIAQEKESLRVLAAEWSYLNQPRRLEKLAAQHLPGLAPTRGGRFVAIASLPLAPVTKEVALKTTEAKNIEALPPPPVAEEGATVSSVAPIALPRRRPAVPPALSAKAREFDDTLRALGVN